jgi:hypothetical protein
MMVVLLVGIEDMARSQFIRSCGTPSPLSQQGEDRFEVIPSICVSERYDSNVFFAPSTPGLRRDDFVTNVNPMFRVTHKGDYASGFLNLGGFSETYVNNPGLNFFGSTGNLYLNLDNSIKGLVPNAGLTITDTVTYTPLPPGFVNPAAGTSPGAPTNIQNIYAQGILAFRANNLINNGTVSTSYATTASTIVNASYSHAMLRFGSSPFPSQGGTLGGVGLFDTTTQTGTVGGTARLSGVDTLNVKYSHAQSEFSVGSASSLFKMDTATIGWSRTLTPNLSAELGGGGILISPGLTTYAANAALILNHLNTSATISYVRSAFPSFIGVAIPVVGDAVSVSARQNIAQQWQLRGAANYSHSSGGSGLNALTVDSYAGSMDLYYWVNRTWSTALSYDYMKFSQQFGAAKFQFDRHVITLSLKATWR